MRPSIDPDPDHPHHGELPSPKSSRDAILAVENVRKDYGTGGTASQILLDVTFDVHRGEFICVVGPSGSGKTTLLNCLAGLISVSGGRVVFEGEEVVDPPKKMAVVFQDYSRSLLPWMTVFKNAELPIRATVGRDERRQRVEESLASVGLAGKGNLYPWQMSGGMQQRAAIARGLAYQPDVLLMDEPFAAVDAQTRIELEDLILEVSAKYQMTVVFVTHDIDESVYLADRVIILSGTPTTVTEDLTINLTRPRNQVETKLERTFAELRAHVFTLIQSASAHALGSPQEDHSIGHKEKYED